MDSSRTSRRRIAAVFFICIGVAVAAYVTQASRFSKSHAAASHEIAFLVRGRVLARVSTGAFDLSAPSERMRLRRVITGQLPSSVSTRFRGVTTRYELRRRSAAAAALRLNDGNGRITVATAPTVVSIDAPVIKQKLRNNCEAAALQVLLQTADIRVPQLKLQEQLAKSGPLDPSDSAAGRVWGDPDAGYVGRPNGGGTAGGFGVYPGPVQRLAAKHGVVLQDLTGRPARSIYATLLKGRAVMVWVGLGDGPYSSWRSPSGRQITVNLNEHTVVLNGLDKSDRLSVVNPLTGRAEDWSKEKFEKMWQLLGRRALST
jgi:uncharacterized protein YvpB